jgi:integrase
MASFRKLKSGLWQATVRQPNGKRLTATDKLKSVVRDWAIEQEDAIRRGVWRDPRAGRITVAEWHERWWAARVVEDSTRRTDEGMFRNHVLPKWGNWPLAQIRRLDVQAWIREMEQAGTGAYAIRYAYNLLSTMLGDAVIDDRIGASPCRRIDLPRTDAKLPAWFTREQVDRIKAELPDGHAAMTELMVCSGPRWGEAAAIVGRARPDGEGNVMDWTRRRLRITGALTQHGKWKEHPKSSKSRREIPVPAHVCDAMAKLLVEREPDDYVFVASRRSPGKTTFPTLSGANWRVRWYQAIDAANERIAEENRGRPQGQRIDPVPRLDPHDCRHTAASWLVQEGVSLYVVQWLLGHESFATTQRYAHLAPDRVDTITDAWSKIMTHERRTEISREGGSWG